MEYTEEICDCCDEYVKLEAKMEKQLCPSCGKLTTPCLHCLDLHPSCVTPCYITSK
jgi:predicted RNA-binding Zn-ribbon protein involved in translation (DUF1610 family)